MGTEKSKKKNSTAERRMAGSGTYHLCREAKDKEIAVSFTRAASFGPRSRLYWRNAQESRDPAESGGDLDLPFTRLRKKRGSKVMS